MMGKEIWSTNFLIYFYKLLHQMLQLHIILYLQSFSFILILKLHTLPNVPNITLLYELI